jgi:hypothetical protein
MRVSVARWALFGLVAILLAQRSHAQGYSPGPGHFGFVLETAAEFGGDDVVKVFYDNGDTQDLRAGQGVTLAAGVHYQPASLPVDFAATVGYKFVRTRDFNSDLGINRIVFKLTGTYALPNHFWVDAGPVLHTSTKVSGAGFIPDINFDDSVGVTLGAGWRWFGISYTNIRYSSAVTGSVDASNVGVTFTWKF